MGVIGTLSAVVIAIALLAAVVWQIGARSQRPRKIANAAAPEAAAAWQSISFMSNGSRLEGWLLQPIEGAGAAGGLLPVVVVAHGWGSNRTRVLRYAHPLYKAGYAVFMYDARSHGNSESIKAPSALMFREDVTAAVDAARLLPGIDPERVSVLGHSLGGFGAILALDQGMKVRSVITDSMPVRFETMMRSELKRRKIPAFPLVYLIPTIWLLRSGISNEQLRAASIPDVLAKRAGKGNFYIDRTPVLMIHSKGDDFISAEDLRRLEEQLPEGTIGTLFVSTEGHSSSEQEPAFWERVLPFLQETLQDGQAAASLEPLAASSCGTDS
ncbi:alpha/beta hydrolase [Paenibacillus harenae]|uniref:alpha/beta hydrolase n=1 Tax=Paenibacillus harenae TaxID=306543 RepID=UPI00040EBB9A|nr:alpha/beta fold hydrolase [Paenibacillus harenae]